MYSADLVKQRLVCDTTKFCYTHCIVYIQECFTGQYILYEEKNKKEINEFSKI